MKTRYQLHCDRWEKGCGSPVCPGKGHATQVVLARGKLPCDVLLIGEAPGKSEDLIGQPFVGPAGSLLDHIVKAATEQAPQVRVACTNLIACMPTEADGQKTAEPPEEAIEQCSRRLIEFVTIANPKLVVTVGKHAKDWLEPGYNWTINIGDVPRVDIQHPAYMLRSNEAQRGLLIQRAIVVIRNAVQEIILKEV